MGDEGMGVAWGKGPGEHQGLKAKQRNRYLWKSLRNFSEGESSKIKNVKGSLKRMASAKRSSKGKTALQAILHETLVQILETYK